MKKIFLTLVLAISSFLLFAQEPVKLITYKNCVGYFNKTAQKYEFEPYVYSGITFSFYSDYISVNDVNHSVYRITENLESEEKTDCRIAKSKCLDEGNNECIFYLVTSKNCDNSYMEIFYKDKAFMYILDK